MKNSSNSAILIIAALLATSSRLSGQPPEEIVTVNFTQAHHPLTNWTYSAQKLFDDGARLLEVDDDGPGTTDYSLSVKFDISDKGTFPDQSGPEFPAEERYDYTLPRYCRVPNDIVGLQLGAAKFANLKLITSGHDFRGWANPANKSIILARDAIDSTTVHEWGHLCGLKHRSDSVENIMYEYTRKERKKIDHDERMRMQKYRN